MVSTVIAKAMRESGGDALYLAEAMEGVSYGLDKVRRDAADVRRQVAALIGMPVVLGSKQGIREGEIRARQARRRAALPEREGRALARGYLNLYAPMSGISEYGLPEHRNYDWLYVMDETQEKLGNDRPFRAGKHAPASDVS